MTLLNVQSASTTSTSISESPFTKCVFEERGFILIGSGSAESPLVQSFSVSGCQFRECSSVSDRASCLFQIENHVCASVSIE